MRTRPLTDEEFQVLFSARLRACEQMPYFARAMFAVTPVAAEGLGTFAVDARWRLYVDPALLLGDRAWPLEVVAAVFVHEIGHLVRDHAGRARSLPAPLAHTAWNYAADAEINDDLLDAGVELPEGCITPELLGCGDGDLAENYYRAIVDANHPMNEEANAPTGIDEPSCGSGAGCVPVTVELGEPHGNGAEDAQGLDAAAAQRVRELTAYDVVDHYSKVPGNVPAGLERWARTSLQPVPVPWQTVLAAAVRTGISDAAGRVNYSYKRPSRRRVFGVVLPSMRQPKVRVAVVLDTSASMSTDQVSQALAQIKQVARTQGVDASMVDVITCDVAAHEAQRFGASMQINGGGGTDMRVGIDAALDLTPRPDVVIVLTDGFTPWPDLPTGVRLVCALLGDRRETLPETPPWASRVEIVNTEQDAA